MEKDLKEGLIKELQESCGPIMADDSNNISAKRNYFADAKFDLNQEIMRHFSPLGGTEDVDALKESVLRT